MSCSACAHAKQRPSPHKPKQHSYKPLEYISSDTCGPINPPSLQGHLRFLSYIDAASRYRILLFLKDRREVGIIMPQFFKQLRQDGRLPRIYRTDNAKELKSKAALHTYADLCIQYLNNTPHQPQENSLAERINQSIMNAARANLKHANLPPYYWEDAVKDAAYKYNIISPTSTGSTPYELWHGTTARPAQLLTFGQLGTIPAYKHKTKLQARAITVRYVYAYTPNHLTVQDIQSQRYHQI